MRCAVCHERAVKQFRCKHSNFRWPLCQYHGFPDREPDCMHDGAHYWVLESFTPDPAASWGSWQDQPQVPDPRPILTYDLPPDFYIASQQRDAQLAILLGPTLPCQQQTQPQAQPKAASIVMQIPPSTCRGSAPWGWTSQLQRSHRRCEGALVFNAADFDKPKALVFVYCPNATPIELSATTTPEQQRVRFELIRAADDDAKVQGRTPTLQETGPTTAKLRLDGAGSFYIKISCEGDPGCVVMSVVIVMALALSSNQHGKTPVAHPENYHCLFRWKEGEWDFDKRAAKPREPLVTVKSTAFAEEKVSIDCGTFDIAKPETAGMEFRASVLLIGGGPKGQRGCDCVGLMFVNNVTPQHEARFNDGSRFRGVVTTNVTNTREYLTLADMKPEPAHKPPYLDAGKQTNRSVFNTRTAPMRSSANEGGVMLTGTHKVTPVEKPFGTQIDLVEVDSPGFDMMCARIKATSRRDDQAMLQFASQDYVFQTFLVAWTDEAGANYEQARGAGRFTFSVLASLRWRQHGSWEIRERDYMKSIHILEQGLAITEPYAPFDGAKSPEEVGFVFDAPVTPLHWKWLLEDKY